MPKSKFQETIFTLMMVIVMVYAMICYNIALNTGAFTEQVFLDAFHELIIMGPIAFILDFFLVGRIATMTALKIADPQKNGTFALIFAISAVSVAWMCPLMSLAATILFKSPGKHIVSIWLQTTVFNFPMAFFWQIFYAGPFVRFLFRHIFKEQNA